MHSQFMPIRRIRYIQGRLVGQDNGLERVVKIDLLTTVPPLSANMTEIPFLYQKLSTTFCCIKLNRSTQHFTV